MSINLIAPSSPPPSRQDSILSTTSSRTDSFFSQSFQLSDSLTPPKPLNGGARVLGRAGSIGRAGLDVPSANGRLAGLGAGRSPNHPRSVSDASSRPNVGLPPTRPYFSFEKDSQHGSESLSPSIGLIGNGRPPRDQLAVHAPSRFPSLSRPTRTTPPAFKADAPKPSKAGDVLVEEPPVGDDVDGKRVRKRRLWKLEGKELGKGAFSSVWGARCEDEEGGEWEQHGLVAVKLMSKEACVEDDRMFTSFTREVQILKKISHPSIMAHITSFATPSHYCLVLPFVAGGELFSIVEEPSKWGLVGAGFVKRVWRELELGVAFLHERGIVHRDIKLENVLLTFPLPSPTTPPRILSRSDLPPAPQPLIKLTDFGLAKEFEPEDPMLSTRCGSDSYAAPEIVLGKTYDGRKTDSWACGVVLFALLTRTLPFGTPPHDDPALEPSSTRRSRMLRIAKGEYTWPPTDTPEATEALSTARLIAGPRGVKAKELVELLLKRDSRSRGLVGQLGGLSEEWAVEIEGDWGEEDR